jgi:hypothetical protein
MADEALAPVNLTRKDSLDDLIGQLDPWFARLRDKDFPDVPDDETWHAWTRALFTEHGGLRRRKTAPKGADNNIRALFGLMRWHGSGGNLEGLFIAQMTADKDKWPLMETYTTCLMAAFGFQSSAVAAWQRTGLF